MSSTTPSPSPSPSPAPTASDSRTTTVGIVLGLAGLLVVGIIIYTTWRLKRRRTAGLLDHDDSNDGARSAKHGSTLLDRAHPAARITPFGSPGGETPRFQHTPGADMRIATRRPDGAWQFSAPQSPLTPFTPPTRAGHAPSPSSSSTTLLPAHVHKKELEAKAARKGYEREFDPGLDPPPPAYGYDQEHGQGGYINHAKI